MMSKINFEPEWKKLVSSTQCSFFEISSKQNKIEIVELTLEHLEHSINKKKIPISFN